MGVDYGGTGGHAPTPEFGVGGTISPQILSYKYKNERSVAFKKRQNSFSAAGGAHDAPQTL